MRAKDNAAVIFEDGAVLLCTYPNNQEEAHECLRITPRRAVALLRDLENALTEWSKTDAT